MIESQLISLATLFFFVVVGGIIAARIKQPIGIGLLVIGALIGPHAFNLIHDQGVIDLGIEVGTILLLFTIGLEFVIPKLVKIGIKSSMIAILKIGIIFFMCYEVGLLFHLNPVVALVFGLLLSLSSTVIIVKILEAKGLYKREEMPILIGILLIEDIVGIVAFTFFNHLGQEGSKIALLQNISLGILVLVFIYFIMLTISKHAVSWFLKNTRDDVVAYIALALCLGFSYLSSKLGLSPAIGAFFAGSIVASLPTVKLFENAIRPYTEIFTSLFFISMGAMVNFSIISSNLWLVGLLTALAVVSRFFAVGLISYLFASFNRGQITFSSMAMVPVSEFSLLIAGAAMALNLGFDFVSIIASVILLTALIMSFTIGYYDKVSSLFDNSSKYDWFLNPKSFSAYIKYLFNEVDKENSQTRRFKSLSMRSLIIVLLMFLTSILWFKLSAFLAARGIVHNGYGYLLHTLMALFQILFIYNLYRFVREMRIILIDMLSYHDSVHVEKSGYIFNNMLIALGLFIVAIYSPFIITAFLLPAWTNIFPFVLLGIVFMRMIHTVRAMSDLKKSRFRTLDF